MAALQSSPQDLTHDGSLLKTVLREGEGDIPGRGARVSIRYNLRLSQDLSTAPFDSSAKRKDGLLCFTLGRKKVIPALELVAQSMTLGEHSVTKCAPPYAFGTKGLKRKGVQGGAYVWLEVEMVEIGGGVTKNLADMTPRERFVEAKECKERGNAFFKEQKFDRALQVYSQSIRLLSNVFYKPEGEIGADEEYKTNGTPDETGFEEANIDEGGENGQTVEKDPNGVSESEKGGRITIADEKSEITNGQVDESKPDDTVETIDVSTAQNDANDAILQNGVEQSQPVENGHTIKPDNHVNGTNQTEDQTNPKEEQTTPSNGTDTDQDPQQDEVKALHVTTLNNLSLCFVKMENYKQAVESATLALRIDPESSKALYYRGRAKIALGEWDLARADLIAAAKIQPNNPGIRNEIIKLDRKVKQFEQREKKQAAAMFA